MVESLRELNRICQKPNYKKEGNWMVRYILRDAALPVTWLLLHTPITANQVTLIALIIGLLGICLMALASPVSYLWGVLLLHLWYFLDHVDGQIARYHQTASLTGRFFDFFMHHLIHGALFFAFGFYTFRQTQNSVFLILGFVVSLAMMHFNLINDTKCKTYVEQLQKKWLHQPAKNSISATVPAAPPAAALRRQIFTLLHKSVEIHIVMNILTVFAVLEAIFKLPLNTRFILFVYYLLVVPVITIIKVSYIILSQKVDQEFREVFNSKAG